jgi:hypothetical protein
VVVEKAKIEGYAVGTEKQIETAARSKGRYGELRTHTQTQTDRKRFGESPKFYNT